MPSIAIPVCSTLILAFAANPDGTAPGPKDSAVASAAAQGGAAKLRSPRIAVINPRAARKSSKWAQQLLASVEKKTAADAQILQGLQKQREKLVKDLELWRPDSREHQALQLDIGVLNTRMQNATNLYSRWRDKALAEALIRVRQRVMQAVEQLAKDRGIDLVIQQTQIPEKASMDQKIAAMGQQLVLYARPEFDLTADVVKLLDSGVGAVNATDRAGSGKSPSSASGKNGSGNTSGKR